MKHQIQPTVSAPRLAGAPLGISPRFASLLIALFTALPALHAADVTWEQLTTFGYAPLPWPLPNQPAARVAAVQQFNPDLGTLKTVTVDLIGKLHGSIRIENLTTNTNVSTVSITGYINGAVSVLRPDGSTLVDASPSVSASYTLPLYDLRLDFMGSSGRTVILDNLEEIAYEALLPSADLALFSGTDWIFLPVQASKSTGVIVTPIGAMVASDFNATSCSADVRITYTYEPREPRISGLVWNDANGDQYYDGQVEAGIAGATVSLSDLGGNPIAGYPPTVTDSTGYYAFNNTPDGDYRVSVTPLAGYVPTYDLDGVETPNVAAVTVAGWDRSDVSFGYQQNSGSIGDRVWADNDGNAVQDANEPGIPNILVTLSNGNGEVLGTRTTDANGSYNFDNLPSGLFRVEVSTPPANHIQTYDLDGVGTPNWTWVYLEAGQSNPDVDFGYQPYGSTLGGIVWNDRDRDGVQDPGEPLMAGALVSLLGASSSSTPAPTLGTFTTGPDGHFQFTGLTPGTYTVQVAQPAGYAPTFDLDGIGTPNTSTYALSSGETFDQLAFGYAQAGVGDRVWHDGNSDGIQDAAEAGIPGATVTLSDTTGPLAVTSTDANGFYTFGDLPGGTYTVSVAAPTGFVPTYDLDGVLSANTATVVMADGQERTDVDFGYREGTGSIGDRVWSDDNGDGVQDAGELGLAGVTVSLSDGNGAVVATLVTDLNGYYSFDEVPAGTYTVCAEQPADYVPTFDLDGPPVANCAVVVLATGVHRTDVDFGYEHLAQVGGIVWDDANDSGNLDAGEPGLSGVTLTIQGSGGTYNTATDANGHYLLTGVIPSTYTVALTPPAGYVATYDLDGLSTPNAAIVALNPGEVRTDVNFGVRQPGSIGDRIWNDANGNGLQDAGEAGISSLTVTLRTPSGTVLASTVSGANGAYSFGGLAAGSYRVSVAVSPFSGLTATYDLDGVGTVNTTLVTLAGGENRTDVDFGYKPATPDGGDVSIAAIGDLVWRDDNGDGVQDGSEPGIEGLTVTLSGAANRTTTTAADGSYTFALLSAGTYTVTVTPPTPGPGYSGYLQTHPAEGLFPPNTATVTLAANENRADVDFGYLPVPIIPPPPPTPTASVGDRVWSDDNGNGLQDGGEAGIAGLAVTLRDFGGADLAVTTTGANGIYGFGGLTAGTYTVVVSAPASSARTYDLDGTGTANQATVVLAEDEHRTDVDFGYQAYASIGDLVWHDANGNGLQDGDTEIGLPGLTVTASGPGGPFSATTDANGFYHFTQLTPGDYVVTVTPPNGYVQTYDLDGVGTLNSTAIAVVAGQDRNDADFGYQQLAAIGDTVWSDVNGNAAIDGGEVGIAGVTVSITGPSGPFSATTDSDGHYLFPNLRPGSYTVTVTPPSPYRQTYDLDGIGTASTAVVVLTAGQDRTDADFGYQKLGSLGGRVWLQDEYGAKSGIPDVPITIDGTNPGVSTDPDGYYILPNLEPGTHTISIVVPEGYIAVYDLDGSDTAGVASVDLAPGQNRDDVDFGYEQEPPPLPAGSIGDRVWIDANGNGVQEEGEAPLIGAVVELFDGSNTKVGSTATDNIGAYSFIHLPPDMYVVVVTPPIYFVPTYDLDGISTPNSASVALADGAVRTDVDFGYKYSPPKGSIGDLVWYDANGNGVVDGGETGVTGVEIKLKETGGAVVATTTTDGTGHYLFSNIVAGSYSVTVCPPASTQPTYDLDGITTPNVANLTLAIGENRTDLDFGYLVLIPDTDASIGDRVWKDINANGVQDAGEPGLTGVTVALRNNANQVVGTTTTGANGIYTFNGLSSGTYTVVVSVPIQYAPTFDLDGIATPNQTLVNLGAHQHRTDVDFGYGYKQLTITCPGNITLGCSSQLLIPAYYSATATGGGDAPASVTYSKPSGSGFPVGVTTVTATATDTFGHSVSCSFTVTRSALGFENIDGFLPPVGGADATGGSYGHPLKSVSKNSTVPFKFRAFCGANDIMTGPHTIQVVKWTSATTSTPAIDGVATDNATDGNVFRLTGPQWHFNLSIKKTGLSNGQYQVIATLSDGSRHYAWIEVKN